MGERDDLLSPKRARLCSLEHANRVGEQIVEERPREIAVVKTGNPLQPLKVIDLDDVEPGQDAPIKWIF